ncbi:permease prefix domain 1-containing protein [Bacillus cereus]|uniref:DUF1129 domain-containing protein n=1 Tax=Bacillus cereus TaxID=1396 RepID=A0A9X6WZ96_BACCE|nr:permease prefix domain 1-containing protein [Bacillus cereus]PFK12715.1 hypothetical protein COI98_21490 [Bacillus cereus]
MLIRTKKLDERIQEYIDKQFIDVKGTQQLFDMKEELFINLKERISDMIKKGYTEEDAFKKGVISIGDLSDLVEEMRLYGEDIVQQSTDAKEKMKTSTKRVIGGILLSIFGIFVSFIGTIIVASFQMFWLLSCVFTLPGILLIIYSLLKTETRNRYAMGKIRISGYLSAIGILLYGFCISTFLFFVGGLELVGIVLFMICILISLSILLPLFFTRRSLSKNESVK